MVKHKAEELAKEQREISISEFFLKNKHLLGFDNPRKALLTTIKEAVDNSKQSYCRATFVRFSSFDSIIASWGKSSMSRISLSYMLSL